MKKDVTINIRGMRHFGLTEIAKDTVAQSGSILPARNSEYRIEAMKIPDGVDLDDPGLTADCREKDFEPDEEELARILQETLDSLTRSEPSSTTELFTEGVLTVHRDGIELSYEESDITGMDGAKTSIYVGRNGVTTFSRTGQVNTHMVFEKNKRYFCICPEAKDIPICISTADMDSSLTADGGEIHIDFCVEIGGSKAEHNEYYINVC